MSKDRSEATYFYVLVLFIKAHFVLNKSSETRNCLAPAAEDCCGLTLFLGNVTE